MRYGPRVTVRGLDCALVQLQMYTAEKDVITSKSDEHFVKGSTLQADTRTGPQQFHLTLFVAITHRYKYVHQLLFVQNLAPCTEYRRHCALYMFVKETEETTIPRVCLLRWFCLPCDQFPGVYLYFK